MPITSSAKKALRQNIRRRAVNLSRKKTLLEVVKKFKKTPGIEELKLVYQKLDKAAKAGLIKRNTAARLKSRLSKKLSPAKKA